MKEKIDLELIQLDEHSYHLFVTATINGQRCELIIDTGASRTVFDINFFSESSDLMLPLEEDFQSSGINSEITEAKAGIIRKIKFGKLILKDYRVILIDLTYINDLYSKVAERKIVGLIGSDFLLNHRAIINYAKKKLILKK
jgi:hypothetical protein